MQRRPKILRAYVQMMGAVSDQETSEVDIGFKRLIAHVTSRAAGCRYCMSHTAALSLGSGIDDARLDEKSSSARRFTPRAIYSRRTSKA